VHPAIEALARRWTLVPARQDSAVHQIALNFPTRLARTLSAAFGAERATRRQPFLGVAIWIPVLLVASARSKLFVLLFGSGVLVAEILSWRGLNQYPIPWAAAIVAVLGSALIAARKHNRWLTFTALTVAAVVAGDATILWWFPHYSAPVVPLIIASAALAVHRRARTSSHYRPSRLASSTLLLTLIQLPTMALPPRHMPENNQPTYVDVRSNLREMGGRHLVFVTYEDYPTFRGDWVYNEADIPASSVVFAHDLGPAKNAEVISAYPGRTVWRLEISADNVVIEQASDLTHH
jgi:hypothetical protein